MSPDMLRQKISTLSSPRLGGRVNKKGVEIIDVAEVLLTTVKPIVQFGTVPFFVDFDMITYNINADLIEVAIIPKTKVILLALTLGNPFNLGKAKVMCERYQMWLVEDCCDALGSSYDGKLFGTFGDIATLSFYPAQHITMGEGGAVFTNNGQLKKIAQSFRDWGRDCYCVLGCDNTCGKRFDQQFGCLPQGYDHKYVYAHLGYNLKITDMQAAFGLTQLDRVQNFIDIRKRNFKLLKQRLSSLSGYLEIAQTTLKSDPSLFGFPVTLKENTGVKRADLFKFLDQNKIGIRLLFAGNLTSQPYYQDVMCRVIGALTNTDCSMNQTLWLGVYPGLGEDLFNFVGEKVEEFFGITF